MSALVQSVVGASGSDSWTVAGANKTITITNQFGSNTTAGNLLVLYTFYSQARLTGTGLPPTSFGTPTTSGITWASVIPSSFTQSDGSGASVRHLGQLWIRGNAAAVSAATVTTVQLQISAALGSSSGGASAEFGMFEFSGIAASSSTGVGGALIDTDRSLSNQTASAPGTANLTTTVSDLVLSFFVGNSANCTAGSGYTIGQTGATATTAQLQYQTGVAPGSIAVGFVGVQGNWGAGSIAFKEAAGGARSRAYFFG